MLGSRKLYRIKSKNQTISCCLHCVEQGVETQFTLCQECGKKTANAFSNGLCYECKINEPYRWQVSSHLSRAKAVGAPATLTLKEWSATVAYFGNKCAYCRNRPFEVLEHFLPIILGGGTTAENCVPACQNCNSRKNSMHPDNFYRIFLPDVIEHIKQYLEGNKQQLVSSFAVNNRALVVMPGMQKIANEGIKLSALKKC